MSSTESTSTKLRPPTPAQSGLVGIASMIAALSLFWMATETHYGKCVDAQIGSYPAIGVSAFNTKTTGPIKLAYDQERRDAIGKCKRFLFI